MKKAGIIVCIMAMVMITLIGAISFVGANEEGLVLVETYPKDGQKNAAVENLGIKLTFNNPINLETNQAANNKCFKISGPDGDLPIKVYYNPDIPEQILVLKDTTETQNAAAIKSSEEYKVSISGNLMDNNGNTLGEDITITFRTVDLKRNNIVYFVLMGLMMFGMVFFSSRKAKADAAAQATGDASAEAFNPYKEAKRTGKSLKEVIAEHDREVAKQQAREAKKDAKMADYEEDEEVEEVSENYRVKGPRPISAAGSTYITGRKAEAEARAAEEERLAKRRAKNKKK